MIQDGKSEVADNAVFDYYTRRRFLPGTFGLTAKTLLNFGVCFSEQRSETIGSPLVIRVGQLTLELSDPRFQRDVIHAAFMRYEEREVSMHIRGYALFAGCVRMFNQCDGLSNNEVVASVFKSATVL